MIPVGAVKMEKVSITEKRSLVMVGASGHGKVCADIAGKGGYEEVFFLDDDVDRTCCAGYPVVGIVDDFGRYLNRADFFVAVGNPNIRRKITERIKNAGGEIATLIHPNAVIASDIKIGEGTVVMAGAVINPGTEIFKAVIVNTSSSIDHDCMVEDYAHVSVGAHLAGNVHVGNETWIGAGVIVSNNVDICGGCIIGAGAVVIRDIREAGTYVGVPARRK